jgi:hypothetical protein
VTDLKFPELDQLVGHIYALSKYQQGCRFLQKKLEEKSASTTDIIFGELFDHLVELMTGEIREGVRECVCVCVYLCVRVSVCVCVCVYMCLFECICCFFCPFLSFCNAVPFFLLFCPDPFGNYLFTKLLEHCTNQQKDKAIQRILPDLLSVAVDLNGTQSLQKIKHYLDRSQL